MLDTLIIVAALTLDWLVGEPRHFHPLVGFGRLAEEMEARLYGGGAVSPAERRRRGAMAALLLLGPLTAGAAWLASLPSAGAAAAALLLYLCLGARSLREHAMAVTEPLESCDLPESRNRVGRMVSRDTSTMDETAVCRAAVESVLENGADAVFATLFWFLVAGAPGALLHRLANTLDAMWGYRNDRYADFGRFAARLDDVLNWVPARLTALAYSAAGRSSDALRCWRSQGRLWESPNAGPVMAAGAGALGVLLGGPARYHGSDKTRPVLGCGAAPEPTDIRRAWRLVERALLLWLAVIAAGGLLA